MKLVQDIGRRLADKPVTIIIQDGTPSTNGRIITLPFEEDSFTACSIAAHEGAHIRFGTIFNSSIAELICVRNPELGHICFNIFEDYRVERLFLAQVFPGFADELLNYALNLRPKDMKIRDTIKNSLYQAYIYLLDPTKVDYENTIDIFIDVDRSKGIVDTYKTVESSILAATILAEAISKHYKPLEGPSPRGRKSSSKKETSGESGKGASIVGESEKGEKGGSSSKAGSTTESLKDLEGERFDDVPTIDPKTTIGSEKEAEEIEKTVKDYLASKGDKVRLAKVVEKLKKERAELEDKLEKMKDTGMKPEYEYSFQAVEENPQHSDSDSEYRTIMERNAAVIQKVRSMVSIIKLKTEQVRGGRNPHSRLQRHDLYRLQADPTFQNIYAKQKLSCGAEIIFLLDQSGSTHRNGAREILQEMTVILNESLKGTAISYAFLGFGAVEGRDIIEQRNLKKFNSKLDTTIFNSNDGYEGNGYGENRDSASIEYCIKYFRNSTPIKILVVCSDGTPYHSGTTYGETEISVPATKRAVENAEALNVKVFAFGPRNTERYYNKMYDKIVLVDDFKDMPRGVYELVRKIGAEINLYAKTHGLAL